MKDAKVICNWQPSSYNHSTIRREFTELLESHGFRNIDINGHNDLRSPAFHAARLRVDDGVGWHQDEGYLGKHRSTICWSNILPTMVRDQWGEVLVAKDGDVIYFDNLTCEHSAPLAAIGANRWFVRARVTAPEERN